MRIRPIIYFKTFIRRLVNKLFKNGDNCYDYILSLGYNCEVAYRIVKYYQSESSGLFNWSYSNTIDELIYALNHFEEIGTGGFEDPNYLFECKNTHIFFHGRAPMEVYMNNTATAEEKNADLEELVSRLEYLKTKFLKMLRNDNRKLYIYKIKDKDIDENVNEKIKTLKQCLLSNGGKNFDLLIVAQESQREKFTLIDNEYKVRFVNKFPPDENVVENKYKRNWNNIFREFYPKLPFIQFKNKKYKFDK